MSNVVGEAYVAIKPEGSTFAAETESIISGGLGKALASTAGLLGGLWVTNKIADFGREGVARLSEIEKTSVLTAAQLKATGFAAGITAEHMETLAKATQEASSIDNELVAQGERVLLNFHHIRAAGGIFDETVKQAANLSVALGQDFPAAAATLGKALEAPMNAARLLKGENILLTTSQKDAIKAFVEAGDTLSAQKLILAAVETQVGGVAAAYGNTLPGELAKAKAEMTDAKAQLSQGLVPALHLGAEATRLFASGLDSIPGPVAAVAGVVFAGAGAFAAIAQPLSGLLDLYDHVSGGLKTMGDVQKAENVIAGTSAGVKQAQVAATAEVALANEAAVASETQLQFAFAKDVPAAAGAVGAREAVIAADAELATANTAAGATSLAALGPLALAAGAGIALGVAITNLRGDADSFNLVLGEGAGSVEDFAAQIPNITHQLDQSSTSVRDFTFNLAQQSIPAAENFATALDNAGISSKEVRAAILEFTNAQHAAGIAMDYNAMSADDQAEADKRLAQATQDANDALQKRLDGVTAAVSAQRSYESSLRQVRDAVAAVSDAEQSLAEAQETLNKAMQPASPADLQKANLDLREAQLRSADATKTVRDEEYKLGVARLTRGADVVGAQRRVEEAKIAETRSVFAIRDAEEALQKTQQIGTDLDTAVIAGRKGVESANEQLQHAQERVTDAQAATIDSLIQLRTAQQQAAGITATATSNINLQRTALENISRTLEPNSPLRANVAAYINQLDMLATAAGIINTPVTRSTGEAPALTGQEQAGSFLNQLFKPRAGGTEVGYFGAKGLVGTVNRPTGIIAGEAGEPEDVLIVPHSKGGISSAAAGTSIVFGPGSVVVEFHGAVPTEGEAYRTGQAAGAGLAETLARRDIRVAARAT